MPAAYKGPVAAALEPVSGYLGLYMGASSGSHPFTGDPEGTVFAFGAVGAANAWLNQNVSVQFSAHAEGAGGYKYPAPNNTADKESRFSGITGAHFAYRNPSSFAIGVFGAFTGSNNIDYDAANTGGLVGGEAQLYLGMLTLYAQGGYGSQFNNANTGMIDKYWFVRGIARYFITHNTKLQGEVGYVAGEGQENTPAGPLADITILSWGASAEHRFGGTPWSVFVKYAGERIEGENIPNFPGLTAKITQHTGLIGAKMNFGERTLFDNDRKGATFELPEFHRAFYWSCTAAQGPSC